eukprot:320552-Chlamydomonas_euryale.AAC.21
MADDVFRPQCSLLQRKLKHKLLKNKRRESAYQERFPPGHLHGWKDLLHTIQALFGAPHDAALSEHSSSSSSCLEPCNEGSRHDPRVSELSSASGQIGLAQEVTKLQRYPGGTAEHLHVRPDQMFVYAWPSSRSVQRCMCTTELHGTHCGEWNCMELMGYIGLHGVARGCMGLHGLHGAAWGCMWLHGLHKATRAGWGCVELQAAA